MDYEQVSISRFDPSIFGSDVKRSQASKNEAESKNCRHHDIEGIPSPVEDDHSLPLPQLPLIELKERRAAHQQIQVSPSAGAGGGGDDGVDPLYDRSLKWTVRTPIRLVFGDLRVAVSTTVAPVGDDEAPPPPAHSLPCCSKRGFPRVILDHVSGVAEPGKGIRRKQ